VAPACWVGAAPATHPRPNASLEYLTGVPVVQGCIRALPTSPAVNFQVVATNSFPSRQPSVIGPSNRQSAVVEGEQTACAAPRCQYEDIGGPSIRGRARRAIVVLR